MGNLAITLHTIGMKERMRELLSMAVPIYERIIGANDPRTVMFREWLDDVVNDST
jgi:hypothetical protein